MIIDAGRSADLMAEHIAMACKRLEEDMWSRLKRHADVADLKVVILQAVRDIGIAAAHGTSNDEIAGLMNKIRQNFSSEEVRSNFGLVPDAKA